MSVPMKRFSLFAVAAWFAAWVVSCSAPEQVAPAESPEMPKVPVAYVTVPDRSEEVTEAAVRSVAALFGADDATRAGEREIESVHTLRSQSGDALCYVVNYRGDRGFVVVSATKDYMPVLAFSDEGRFDVESIDKTGVSVWLAEQQAVIERAAELPDSVRLRCRAMWEAYNTTREPLFTEAETRSYDDVIYVMTSSVSQWQLDRYTVYRLSDFKDTADFLRLPKSVRDEILWTSSVYANPRYGGRDRGSFVLIGRPTRREQVGPLLTTFWEQGGSGKYDHWADYNQELEQGVALGCTTVAAGQIMKYHRFPARYDWSNMPDSEPAPTTARFLTELGRSIGIDYRPGKASSARESQVLAAFKSYGYKNAVLVDPGAGNLFAELRQNRPVYMRGNLSSDLDQPGHAWVCDGYKFDHSYIVVKLMVLEDCPEGYEPQRMNEVFVYGPITNYEWTGVHVNWGDGIIRTNEYYATNNILGDDQNYSFYRKNIENIYPVE